jgi:hypothetical protein
VIQLCRADQRKINGISVILSPCPYDWLIGPVSFQSDVLLDVVMNMGESWFTHIYLILPFEAPLAGNLISIIEKMFSYEKCLGDNSRGSRRRASLYLGFS